MSILKEKFGLEVEVVNPLQALKLDRLPEQILKDIEQLHIFSPQEFGAYYFQLGFSPDDQLMNTLDEGGIPSISRLSAVLRLHENSAKAKKLLFYNSHLSFEQLRLKDQYGKAIPFDDLPPASFNYQVLSNRVKISFSTRFLSRVSQFSALLILFVAREVNSLDLENKLVFTAEPSAKVKEKLLKDEDLSDQQRLFLLERNGLKETVRIFFDTAPLQDSLKLAEQNALSAAEMEKWKKGIRAKVASGTLEEVFSEILSEAFKHNRNNELTLISSRFQNLKREIAEGTISSTDAELRRTQITKALLGLLEKL